MHWAAPPVRTRRARASVGLVLANLVEDEKVGGHTPLDNAAAIRILATASASLTRCAVIYTVHGHVTSKTAWGLRT